MRPLVAGPAQASDVAPYQQPTRPGTAWHEMMGFGGAAQAVRKARFTDWLFGSDLLTQLAPRGEFEHPLQPPADRAERLLGLEGGGTPQP